MLSSWVCRDEILTLGYRWDFDVHHAALVNRLALQLFDQFQPIHHMGGTERLWLSLAAWLHDIGKYQGSKDHHKRGETLILKDRTLSLSHETRHMVALLVRYHRGESPRTTPQTDTVDRENLGYLRKLTALLRVADGLDRAGQGLVEDIACHYDDAEVHLDIFARDTYCLTKLQRKSHLFQTVYKRPLIPHLILDVPTAKFPLDSTLLAPYAETL
jgi:exopolyphosphatase/guanosine-5'-triphosphate,3'-diphosphate pyrophosphatase